MASADRDKDDIAAALHGLNSGAHADTGHGEEVVADQGYVAPKPAPPPSPTSAKPGAKTSAKPQAAKRPAAPTVRPATPGAPPSSSAPARPASVTSTPPAPVSRSSGSSSRRTSTPTARPAQPVIPAPTPAPDVAIEDDTMLDASTAPALDYRGPTVQPTGRKTTPFIKTIGFRQTMIPILLSTGLMMLVLGVAHWVVDEQAQLALVPAGASATLAAVGAVLMLLGVANMLFVRAELAQRAANKSSA